MKMQQIQTVPGIFPEHIIGIWTMDKTMEYKMVWIQIEM